uniref:Uncharacterized protein n=1 Tax=Glossina palpalis gambiensis TaxID=67801 RepID=A0A1B0BK76_9MUSC
MVEKFSTGDFNAINVFQTITCTDGGVHNLIAINEGNTSQDFKPKIALAILHLLVLCKTAIAWGIVL